MADVHVREAHALEPTEAKQRVLSFEDDMKKFGVKASWKGTHADLKGTGVSGSIEVTSSEVTVSLKLGMLARAAGIDAQRLEGSIRKRLKAALAGE